jgi:hypothetical protein
MGKSETTDKPLRLTARDLAHLIAALRPYVARIDRGNDDAKELLMRLEQRLAYSKELIMLMMLRRKPETLS